MPETIEAPPKERGLMDSISGLTAESFAAAKRSTGTPPSFTPPDQEDPPPDAPADPQVKPEPGAPAAKDGMPDPTAAPAAKDAKDDDADIPANLTGKGKADWKGLRDARRKLFDENQTLKTKIAALEAAQPQNGTGEVEALKKQLAEYEDRLIVTGLEKHPKFQAYFNSRTEALMKQAKDIGGEKVANLLQLPDSEYRTNLLRDAWADLDQLAQSRLGAVVNSFEDLKHQREAELANSRERWQALQTEQEQNAKAQAASYSKVLDTVLDRWSDQKNGVAAMQTRENDADWNTGVESRKELAREIFTGNRTVEEMAKAAAWAAVAPELAKQLNGAKKVEAELRAEIAQLKAAKPGITGGAEDGEATNSKLNFMEAMNKMYRR